MQKELIKELQRAQEKLEVINKLSNCLQKINTNYVDDIAHLIHRICEANYIDTTLSREVQHWQIEANKDIFTQLPL